MDGVIKTNTQNGGAPADSFGRERDISQQVKALGRDLKDQASQVAETVTQTAKDQMGELGTAAKDLATDARGKVESTVNQQKNVGADYIGNIASAVQRAASEFDGDTPQAAHYIRHAAGQLDSVANAVRTRDVRELISEVEQFARRQPTLFFGGALFLGFAAMRFLKTSAPAPQAVVTDTI